MRTFAHARRLTAAAATALAAAALGTGTAHAADQPGVGPGFINPVIAPGSVPTPFELPLQASASTPLTVSGVTVSYDVSGLAGVAALVPQGGTCTTSGTVTTCHVGTISVNTFNDESPVPYFGERFQPLTLTSVAGAAAGASGTFAVTVSATGAVSSSSTITVSLADGPNLVVKGGGVGFPKVAVTAGSAFSRSVVFTNDGDQAAQGVTVEIMSDGYGVEVPQLHSNCQYQAPAIAFCYIPDLVAPRATETLSPSIQFLTTTDLMWQGVSITVIPGYAALPNFSVGTGKPFTLKDSTGKTQTPISGHVTQQNIDGPSDTLLLDPTVTGSSADITPSIDLSLGPQIFVQWLVEAGVANNGPGYVQLSRSGNEMLTGDISVPSGVTFTTVPITWTPVVNGAPDGSKQGVAGYTEYQFTAGIQVAAGSSALSFPDVPVITTQPGFAGGTGTISVSVNGLAPSGWLNPYFGNIDSNPSNDTMTFNVPAYGSGS